MLSKFFLEVLKNPFSFPSIMLIFLLAALIAITKLNVEIFKKYKADLKTTPWDSRKKILITFLISVILFISSSFLIFSKLTEIPPSGLDIDDGMYVISAVFLKNLGHDSRNNLIPYYPLTSVKYHKKIVWEVGQRAVPVYLQVFLQYLVPPGFFSLRLESTLLILFTSIIIIYTFYLLTNNFASSILCGALFNTLPWTRILARITPESTAYCFGASCFLFSLLYLYKKRGVFAILFYITSLIIFFQSYTPALMFAPMCAIVIPVIVSKYSAQYKSLKWIIILSSVLSLAFIYFQFRHEEGYQYNLERANVLGCLEGINTFDITKIFNGLLDKGHVYIANYIAYFLPQFLFISGDANLRHNTGFGGQLFITLSIAFYVGLVYLIEQRKDNPDLRFILIYLLLSAIPYSICVDGALNIETKLPLHGLRSSCMLPVLTLITGLGLLKIFNKSKILFLIYAIAISANIYFFYYDYFHIYPTKLGNSAVDDPGLRKLSKKALEILEKEPERKLFYKCTSLAIAYHNIKKIGINSLFNGDGILSNVYSYEYEKNIIQPKAGDLFLVQENFDYSRLNRKIKYILRLRHPYLPDNAIGASLFEIAE